MKIQQNYNYPNNNICFGKLLKTTYSYDFNAKNCEKCLNVFDEFVNSKAIQQFCQKYDVVADFSCIKSASKHSTTYSMANLGLEYHKNGISGLINLDGSKVEPDSDACVNLACMIKVVPFGYLEGAVKHEQQCKQGKPVLVEKFNKLIEKLESWNK